ncbi:hypothetical protein GCM10023092_27290 [Rurimicrobium arvi]|uniref:Uncharacterized protein n=1 Tax=Rurimicrobium arvi TaxID=2049916 RepID=A0ABP8MZG8_9BACT
MLKDFYRAVSYVWTNATPDVSISMVGRQLDSLAQKYCTRELRLKAKKTYETTSFDLLMNENSYEIVPPESLIVINDTRPNSYIVSYKSIDQDASGKRIPTAVTLHVVVVRCKDGYRISEIK